MLIVKLLIVIVNIKFYICKATCTYTLRELIQTKGGML